MANWARSLNEGLQTGLQIGSALREKQLRGALAEEAAKYTPTEGAYGQGLQSNIEQVQGLKQQAIEGGMTPEQAAQQYDPSIQELTRRAGLTAPDYSIGSDEKTYKTYATRDEATRAALPMRAQGMAGVYRQFGEAEKADAAETRAQQAEASGLQIRSLQRKETEDLDTIKRQQEDAKWWQTRLTDAEGKQRAPTQEDFLASSQRNVGSLIAAGKLGDANEAYNKYMTTAIGQINLQTATRGEAIKQAAAALQQGDFAPLQEFYHKYVPNGASVDKFTTDAKGNVTIHQKDLNGNAIPPVTMTRDQLLQGLVSFNDPAKLIDYTQQSFMNNIRTQQLELERQKVNQSGQYNKILAGLRAGTPTMLVDDKGNPVPVALSEVPRVNGVYQLPKGLHLPKEMQQETAAEARRYENLTKSEAWQTAERKGDVPAMNKLLVGRGLDPGHWGSGGGVGGWNTDTNKGGAATTTQQQNTTPPAAPTTPKGLDPLSLQIDRETEELSTGQRAAYSPEVQAALDARGASRRAGEQSYLEREQQLATGRGLWR